MLSLFVTDMFFSFSLYFYFFISPMEAKKAQMLA